MMRNFVSVRNVPTSGLREPTDKTTLTNALRSNGLDSQMIFKIRIDQWSEFHIELFSIINAAHQNPNC